MPISAEILDRLRANDPTLTTFTIESDYIGDDGELLPPLEEALKENDKITSLIFSECTSLTKLPELPAGITKLNLIWCSSLTELPELPAGITSLYLFSCESLTELPKLPAGITSLNLSGCESLTKLPELPAGITSLNLFKCESLTELPKLPAGITDLNLTCCESLTELQELPAGITDLNLAWCIGLTKLQELPAGITDLNLFSCNSLTELPELPAGITSLDLSGCESLTELPKLPAGITSLSIDWCTGLTELPELPAGITSLILFRCNSLTELPKLPAGITDLNLTGCSSLTELPELPAGITSLNLSECGELELTPDLAVRLSELEEKGCIIPYPSHFSHEDVQDMAIRTRLDRAIERYLASPQHGSPDPMKELANRFLAEHVNNRGGADAVRSRILPIIKLLEKNPDHLTWMSDIAGVYLDGCVNQPDGGIAEIGAWVCIANAEELPDKVEAARQLMVLNRVKEFVASDGPGAAVEIEGGNALFREVHVKLLADEGLQERVESWVGVPGPIAYAGTITPWLTEARIAEASERAMVVMRSPVETIAGKLCEIHHDTWSQIALPQEISEVKEFYNKKEAFLGDLVALDQLPYPTENSTAAAAAASAESELDKILSDEGVGYSEEDINHLREFYRDLFESNKGDQGAIKTALIEIYGSLATKRAEEIATIVREKTMAALEVGVGAGAAAAAAASAGAAPGTSPESTSAAELAGKHDAREL